jgi:hypothetical protein
LAALERQENLKICEDHESWALGDVATLPGKVCTLVDLQPELHGKHLLSLKVTEILMKLNIPIMCMTVSLVQVSGFLTTYSSTTVK